MTRFLLSGLVLFVLGVRVIDAADSSIDDYIKDFAGRWVCEAVADEDVDGYWNTGDKLRLAITHIPTDDRSGLRYEWQVEKDGKVVGKSHGITTWDPDNKCLKVVGFAAPGFLVNNTITKEGDAWIEKSVVTFPDGTKGKSLVKITSFENGKKRTNAITDRISHTGQTLPDINRVWTKLSKNHDMLDKHLGWLIGTWTAKYDDPVLAPNGILPFWA